MFDFDLFHTEICRVNSGACFVHMWPLCSPLYSTSETRQIAWCWPNLNRKRAKGIKFWKCPSPKCEAPRKSPGVTFWSSTPSGSGTRLAITLWVTGNSHSALRRHPLPLKNRCLVTSHRKILQVKSSFCHTVSVLEIFFVHKPATAFKKVSGISQ